MRDYFLDTNYNYSAYDDELHDVIIESDLTIFRDNRPATTSGSGSIVPLPFDDSDFSVDDLPY